ncbi:response regulator transcription factor [Terasakiella pusilla]|uniref:response regulator transcription factor n=1 Tax=Terasakiella pusilla TaxID=64973 RepID=UPI003AA91187
MNKDLVHIVDDDAQLRDAMVGLLQDEGFRVVAYESAERFLVAPQIVQPSCIVLDVKMDGMSGYEMQKKIADRDFVPPIIFLTGSAPVEDAVTAMRDGAVNFLMKPTNDDKLIDAIIEAIEKSRSRAEFMAQLELLTKKERQIARLLNDGLLSKQIANELHISVRTVEWHRQNISEKIAKTSN